MLFNSFGFLFLALGSLWRDAPVRITQRPLAPAIQAIDSAGFLYYTHFMNE